MPILDTPLKKIVRGPHPWWRECASKTWSFSSACKNFEAQHPLGPKYNIPKKSIWVGTISLLNLPWLVDQSSLNFFHPTWEESRYKMYSSNYEYLHLFQSYSPLNFEFVWKRAKFCMFLAPRIFWRWAPKILDRHYKIRPSADHHAKFCADRLTHLEDLTLKGKKHLQ